MSKYYGYKIIHHMAAMVDHIEKFGFNTFDHPRIADGLLSGHITHGTDPDDLLFDVSQKWSI